MRVIQSLMLGGLAAMLCAVALPAQAAEGWTPGRIERLRAWIDRAPEDALPRLATDALDAAEASGDGAAIDSAASDLALRLARMHLLGSAKPSQRAGWHIADSDTAVNLEARLDRAVAVDLLDAFFAGLAPKHGDYAVLRAAYAAESDGERRATLARNMERWRWLPQDPGADHILVNAAAFEARLQRGGEPAGRWRVIVGKTSTPTPVFSAKVTGVILNPWWTVPASIVREMGGRFPASKGYVRTGGQIRQKPGPNNALGEMKLDMPNPYTVYMHDTPSKQLFEKDVRAFSHGCIRTGDALGFAATLLEGIRTRKEIDAIVRTRRTTTVPLSAPLPVYVAYFTAGTDGDGNLSFYPDIYGRDARMGKVAALRSSCAG